MEIRSMFRMVRAFALLATLLLSFAAGPAGAAVKVTFYSKELGSSFPHTFVIVEGTLDRNGEPVNEDYGFSAKTISPAILFGRVKGEVISDHSVSYVKGSDQHFTLTLTDAEYDQMMAVVGRWRSLPQPSYDLNGQNCVHFVAQLATSIGMRAEAKKGLMKKPRSYLESITEANRAWLKARGAVLHRAP